ncbi:hypothetical protein MMC17_002221 [Xylographa soralifera]|nr:hypothetical protein [Xylographa soralifera]
MRAHEDDSEPVVARGKLDSGCDENWASIEVPERARIGDHLETIEDKNSYAAFNDEEFEPLGTIDITWYAANAGKSRKTNFFVHHAVPFDMALGRIFIAEESIFVFNKPALALRMGNFTKEHRKIEENAQLKGATTDHLSSIRRADEATARNRLRQEKALSRMSLSPADQPTDSLNEKVLNGLESQHDSRSQISLDGTVGIEAYKEAQIGHSSLLRHFRGGWRTGVTAGMITAFFVMIINTAVLCWVSSRLQISNGVAIAFEGSCEEMSRISTWSHLAINVLSTLLLGANNMVLFSSRSSTNYVAVLVAENFLTGGYWNQTRFQFNMTDSTDSKTITDADVQLIEALQNNSNTLNRLENIDCINAYSNQIASDWHNLLLVANVTSQDTVYNIFPYNFSASNSPWTWLCASKFVDVGHNDMTRNDTLISYDNSTGKESSINIDTGCAANLTKVPDAWQFSDWSCPSYQYSYLDFNTPIYGSLDHQTLVFCSEPTQQSVLHIDHCLAESATGHCRIEINRTVLAVVLICNAVKVLCLLSTLLIVDFLPLITVGDAVASFLAIPDHTTSGDGTNSERDVAYKQEDKMRSRPTIFHYPEIYRWQPPSKVWRPRQPVWSSGASPRRFFATVWLSLLFWLAISLALIYLATYSSTAGISSVWTTGFGAISMNSLINITVGMSLTGTILITNMPQMLLSVNYFLYNSLYTGMLLTAETNSYAIHRKALRVSNPRGAQRSTYYLQLPYRYAIPLMIVFGALHWAFSQSVFFVQINVFDVNVQPLNTIQACGWSAPALATAIALGYVASLALWAIGKRKYHAGMPIMSSCSLAISAACHAPPGDEHAAVKKVMYGATWRSADGTEYAGFSSQDVRPLKAGIKYGREILHEEVAVPNPISTGQASFSFYTRAEMSMPPDNQRRRILAKA